MTLEPKHAAAQRGSDELLVRALGAGDERAVAELLASYHGEVFGLLVALVRATDAARALAIEIWREVLERVDEFDRSRPLRTWILRLAAGRARTLAAGDVAYDMPQAPDAQRFTADGRWRTPPSAWSEPAFSHAGGCATLRRALHALPRMVHAALQLRDVQGLSLADTADVLALSTAEVRALLHQGRAALRCTMEARIDADRRRRQAPRFPSRRPGVA